MDFSELTGIFTLSLPSSSITLCSSLEYDPRLYGLFLHDDQQLPSDQSMWDYLDDLVPGYQDSLVLHMIHKPVMVCLDGEEER